MIELTTGDILQSKADALVNTVNCEGFMGKGIAYQFKLTFPENYSFYSSACKAGLLRPGKLIDYKEKDKVIINFPTKDKWREKSKIQYIEAGLIELVNLVSKLNIKSIAIPPLGCGNGGLDWNIVKPLITNAFLNLEDNIDVIIYEPSKYYKSKPQSLPNLNASHLIIMSFKDLLTKFTKLRIQKTAYFTNIFSCQSYFSFKHYTYGPYSHAIDILIKDIKEYQNYFKVETSNAMEIAKRTLISDSVKSKLSFYQPFVVKSAQFINSFNRDLDVELVSSVCAIVEEYKYTNRDHIVTSIKKWSDEKAKKFDENRINWAIDRLIGEEVFIEDFTGAVCLCNCKCENEVF